ncbi:hypothetical protein SALBM311S_09114 [Streptomyces alboniger]
MPGDQPSASSSKPKPKPKVKSSSASSSQKAQQAQQSAATTQSAVTTSTANGFTLPVSGAVIGTGYHVAGSMWASGYHTGVDFIVPTGTPLKAVGAGTVVSAGWGGAYGNQVVIKLADGYYAQYAHLSALSVSSGQTVTEGQQVGLSGATGNVTAHPGAVDRTPAARGVVGGRCDRQGCAVAGRHQDADQLGGLRTRCPGPPQPAGCGGPGHRVRVADPARSRCCRAARPYVVNASRTSPSSRATASSTHSCACTRGMAPS